MGSISFTIEEGRTNANIYDEYWYKNKLKYDVYLYEKLPFSDEKILVNIETFSIKNPQMCFENQDIIEQIKQKKHDITDKYRLCECKSIMEVYGKIKTIAKKVFKDELELDYYENYVPDKRIDWLNSIHFLKIELQNLLLRIKHSL